MSNQQELRAIRNRAIRELFKNPHVTGVGLGPRERRNEFTGEPVLKVAVKRKMPAGSVGRDELIPGGFEDVRTDVIGLADPVTHGYKVAYGKTPKEVNRTGPDRQPHGYLRGGIVIASSERPMRGGTLGCFVVDPQDETKVYALTNYHVVGNTNRPDPPTGARVGHPNAGVSFWNCASNQFGTYAAGRHTGDGIRRHDAALIELDPGTCYVPDIYGLGPVRGIRPIIGDDMYTDEIQVIKRGIRTGVTGGVIIVHDFHIRSTLFGEPLPELDEGGDDDLRSGDMVVRPNPNPALPDEDLFTFSYYGDSGSVVLDSDSKVVGLLWGGMSETSAISDDGHPPEKGDSLLVPIQDVLTEMKEELTLDHDLQVATTENSDDPPLRVPYPPGQEPTNLLVTDPSRHHRVIDLTARMRRSERGARLAELWTAHYPELFTLINTNRRVATVWHRSGTAAIFQHLVRMADDSARRLPDTVDGRPLGECLDRFSATAIEYGSAELAADVAELRELMELEGGRTFSELLAALEAAS